MILLKENEVILKRTTPTNSYFHFQSRKDFLDYFFQKIVLQMDILQKKYLMGFLLNVY